MSSEWLWLWKNEKRNLKKLNLMLKLDLYADVIYYYNFNRFEMEWLQMNLHGNAVLQLTCNKASWKNVTELRALVFFIIKLSVWRRFSILVTVVILKCSLERNKKLKNVHKSFSIPSARTKNFLCQIILFTFPQTISVVKIPLLF